MRTLSDPKLADCMLENTTVALDAESAQGPDARWTAQQRREYGRSLRRHVPRSSHGSWVAASTRPDPLTLLGSQAKTRVPALVPIRYARMRVSPFAFFRGSAIIMAADLAHTPTTGITTQICGDAPLANFGLYASPERSLLFDINDFDETLPGPWEWDVKRLAASIFIAGRSNGFKDRDSRAAVASAARSYRRHMAQFADVGTLAIWYTRVTAEDLLDTIQDRRIHERAQQQMGKARQRTSLQALSTLTHIVGGRRLIADDPPLVAHTMAEDDIETLRQLYRAYQSTLRGAQSRLLERYQIVDIAQKVVGVGSVGARCFILLLTGRDDDDPLFLQVKEAERSVLEAHLPPSEWAHHGERVVAGQELVQAASDITLGWVRGPGGRDFYVRQLRDMKGSAVIEKMGMSQFGLWANACAWALARAHARSGDPIEIAAYLGKSDTFDHTIAAFADSYANQVEQDYRAFLDAIKRGRIVAESPPGANAGTHVNLVR